eukprot:m.336016 g.336016  ORF g.336016 m.336016 type:complete len:356 (+) comp17734_c0_seq1:180-1247(+)
MSDLYTSVNAVDKLADNLAKVDSNQTYLEIENEKQDAGYAEAELQWYHEEAKKHNYDKEAWYHGPIPREKAEKYVIGRSAGVFLVRASTKKTSSKTYAITVSVGMNSFIHIAVRLGSDGKYKLDSHSEPFPRIHEIISYLTTNKYKGVVSLTKGVIMPVKSKANNPPSAAKRVANAPPVPVRNSMEVRQSMEVRDSIISTPDTNGADYLVPGQKLDFTSEHLYAGNLSSDDEDDDELKMATLKKDVFISRELPANVSDWNVGDVQKWLKSNGLQAFRNPFYVNGVGGPELLNVNVEVLPKARYPQEQCEKFKKALETAKQRKSDKSQPKEAVPVGKPTSEQQPPPVPGRPSLAFQ